MIQVFVQKKAAGEELKWDTMSADELATLASTPDMFGGSRVFVLAGALYGERGDELLGLAEGLAASSHTFIFEEEKLLKAERTRLEKAGAKIVEAKKEPKPEWRFDQYAIAEALGGKDKKKLWLGLMAAFAAREKGEAVAGLMAWKARQLKDAKLSAALVRLYHDSHRGRGDLELLLEQFALKL